MNYEIENQQQKQRLTRLLSTENHTLAIPITHLSHWTHDTNARDIENDGGPFVFKTHEKQARQNSYKYNIDYQTVEELQTVLPGHLTWWGINVLNWYETDGANVRQIESALQGETNDRVFLPPYLQYIEDPRQGDDHGNSVYGRNSFTFPLSELIENYKMSRRDCIDESESKVYFKKAGTLRYMHEICYVVLVCTSKDLEEYDNLRSMEGAGQEDGPMTYFDANEFIARDGEVLDSQQTPSFISEYPIRAIYPARGDRRMYSWDTLNFAFYYPNEDGELCVPRNDSHKKTTVQHDRRSCHLGPRNCPDSD